jgi:hypothetical protein
LVKIYILVIVIIDAKKDVRTSLLRALKITHLNDSHVFTWKVYATYQKNSNDVKPNEF